MVLDGFFQAQPSPKSRPGDTDFDHMFRFLALDRWNHTRTVGVSTCARGR